MLRISSFDSWGCPKTSTQAPHRCGEISGMKSNGFDESWGWFLQERILMSCLPLPSLPFPTFTAGGCWVIPAASASLFKFSLALRIPSQQKAENWKARHSPFSSEAQHHPCHLFLRTATFLPLCEFIKIKLNPIEIKLKWLIMATYPTMVIQGGSIKMTYFYYVVSSLKK